MKTRMTLMVCGVWMALGLIARAQNNCIEGGPYTNDVSCYTQGTWTSGAGLSPTNITVGAGQPIPQPTAIDLSVTGGSEIYYVSYDCSPQLDGWFTSPINYSIGNLFFVPQFPQVLWNPGTYYYTGEVVATGSPCGPLTNNLGVVTIDVTNGAPDVLIDVDFGAGMFSRKWGFAAIGDYTNDFWNEYGQTNQSSGSLTNLLTVQQFVSPVGLVVTNLPAYGINSSPDPMYNDYLYTNGGTATVTITNLPTGTWNFYLYADDGNFSATVSNATNYGPVTCYDANPATSALWQQGVQYAVLSNVLVSAGQPVTIAISPGTNGAAMLSGMQIVSSDHDFPPVITNQPVNVVTNFGATVSFSVGASGNSLHYQWYQNDVALTNSAGIGDVFGVNSSTLTLVNVTLQNDGLYWVVVSNQDGSTTSLYASLRVWAPGGVIGWGYNGYGQTNVPAGLTNVVAIAAGQEFSMALTQNGIVSAWGYNGYGQTNVPAGLSNVLAVAAGANHCLALLENGTVVAWGYNGSGQTNVPAGLSNVVAIAAGENFSLALQNNGRIAGWGDNSFRQITAPAGFTNVVSIAAEWWDTTALAVNGAVTTWGDDIYGETNLAANLTNVVAVASGASAYHSLALNRNGTVTAWGRNDSGDLSVPAGATNVVALAAGSYPDFSLALLWNGTIVGWGGNGNGQTTVPAGLTNVVAIAAGGSFSLALVDNGELPWFYSQGSGLSSTNGLLLYTPLK